MRIGENHRLESARTASGHAAQDARRGIAEIPRWAAVVSLSILLAAAGFVGFQLRSLIDDPPQSTSEVADAEIVKWTKALEKNPNDLGARVNLAYAYQENQEWALALEHWDSVIRADPANTGAHFQRGVIYSALSLDTEAEAAYRRVLEFEPTHVQAAAALGRRLADLQQYEAIVASVQPAAVAHPDSAELQYLMGLAYEHLDHWDWSIERYRLALQAVPDYTEAHAGLIRLGALPAQ